MKDRLFRRVVALLLVVLLVPSIGLAKGRSGSGGTVHVKGFYRKDGTYVSPHTRSEPRSGGSKPSGGSYTPPAYTPDFNPSTASKPKSSAGYWLIGSIGILVSALLVSGRVIVKRYTAHRINLADKSLTAELASERELPPSTEDKTNITCPCGARFIAPVAWVGRKLKCGKCGTVSILERLPIP